MCGLNEVKGMELIMNKELPYGMQKFLDTLKYVNKLSKNTLISYEENLNVFRE